MTTDIETLAFEVTQEDWDAATHSCCDQHHSVSTHCLVATAFKRQYPDIEVIACGYKFIKCAKTLLDIGRTGEQLVGTFMQSMNGHKIILPTFPVSLIAIHVHSYPDAGGMVCNGACEN